MKKITDNIYLAKRAVVIEGDSSLTIVDPGYDSVAAYREYCRKHGRPDIREQKGIEGTSVEKIRAFSRERGKPIERVIITHWHGDHVANLPFYTSNEPFPEIILSAYSPGLGRYSGTRSIMEDNSINLDGVEYQFLITPGHTQAGDDMSVYMPHAHVLFPGDLVQPQGPSYEQADNVSHMPYFYHGEEYLESLDRLMKLDFHQIVTQHGDIFPGETGRNALMVAHHAVRRIKELADKLTSEHPEEDTEVICEWIYDMMAWERGYKERAEERKSTRDYHMYDKPGILYFINKALSRGPGKLFGNASNM